MNPFRRRREERRRRERARRETRRRTPAAEPGAGERTERRLERAAPAERPQPGTPRPPERSRKALGQLAEGTAATRSALGKGLGATGRRARAAQPRLAGPARRLEALLRAAAAFVLRLLARLERTLRWLAGLVAAVLGGAAARLSRLLTPERGVFLVTVAAAACLVVAQFLDYRGVEIGQAAYAEVADIAPPPQVDTRTAGEAHTYLLIPVAAIAVALAAAALRTRRWQLGRVVALAGLAAVAVILLVDLPKGLDEGSAGIRYNGAHATLGDAFYAELAAAGGLVLCGFLLSFNLRRARRPAPRARRTRRRQPRAGKARSLARSGT